MIAHDKKDLLNGKIGLQGLKRAPEDIFQLMRSRPGKDNARMPARLVHAFKMKCKVDDEFVLRGAYLEVVGITPTTRWRRRNVDKISCHNALTSNCTAKGEVDG